MITPNSNITIMICNNVISNPIRKPNRLCGEELGGGGEGILPWDYSTLFKGHSLFQRGHLSRRKKPTLFRWRDHVCFPNPSFHSSKLPKLDLILNLLLLQHPITPEQQARRKNPITNPRLTVLKFSLQFCSHRWLEQLPSWSWSTQGI